MHLNREKFNPNRHRDECERIDQSFVDRMTMLCCKRCCDKLQWKLDYGKYEVQNRARKCNVCEERNVVVSYHRVCQKCAWEKIVCAKCQKKPTLHIDSEHAESGPEEGESDDGSEKPEGKQPAGNRHTHVLDMYNFVNVPDEDEEFHPYVGLDIRRIKHHMRAVRALAEKEEINNLRERERRSRLRMLKKLTGDSKEEADDDDSNDEPL